VSDFENSKKCEISSSSHSESLPIFETKLTRILRVESDLQIYSQRGHTLSSAAEHKPYPPYAEDDRSQDTQCHGGHTQLFPSFQLFE